MNNQEQLEKFKSGDRETIKQVYQNVRDSCQKYILKRGGDDAVAEEVLHEALYRFYVKLKKLEPGQMTRPMEGIIFGYIKIVWLEKCKSSTKKKNWIVDIDDNDNLVNKSMADTVHEQEFFVESPKNHLLFKVIDQLGTHCKEVLIAFYVNQYSLQEIAEEYDFTYNYVKVKRFRCMQELRKKYLAKSA